MRELRQADAGRSHVGSPPAGQLADLRLRHPGIGQRRGHLVIPGGALARTVIAQVVQVHAVDDVLVAAIAAHFLQAGEQFVLAMETAVGIVAGVIRVIELARLNVLVDDAEALPRRLPASRLWDSGMDAESAVTASAFFPST